MAVFPGPGVLGLPSSTMGETAGTPGAITPPNSLVQNPNIVVVVTNFSDGTTHILDNVLGCTTIYGYDVGVSSATVELAGAPSFTGAALTGTVSKTAGTNILTGSGTAFTTELSVSQSISVPGGGVTEVMVVGEIIDDENLTVTQSFVATATGQTANQFTTLSNYSSVYIYCDAGTPGRIWPSGTPTLFGHPLRFSGLYLRTEATLDPHTFSMVCRGNLYRAEQYRQSRFIGLPAFALQALQKLPIGLLFDDLLAGATATDENIVTAILHQVPNLSVTPSDIGGTGRVFGSVNLRQMVWPPYQSALDMVQQFDQVCLGFRLFETMAGRIVRSQVFGYPDITADTQFTEGVDIWEGRGMRTIEPLVNAAYVEGASLPSGDSGLIFAFIQSENPFQPIDQPVVEQFSSPWIEGPVPDPFDPAGVSSPGDPLNPIDVALWRLSERNRELVNVQFVTFRDDILFPGHTIAVLTPHMAVTEPVWLQRVELRMTSDPVLFQQTLYGLGGGLPGYASGIVVNPPPNY